MSAETPIRRPIPDGWMPTRSLLCGVLLGLFLIRLALEGIGQPLPEGVIVGMAALAAVVGALFWRRFAQRRPLWPFLPVLLYIFWPRHSPWTGVSLAFLAVLLWLLTRRWGGHVLSIEGFVDAVLFIGAFTLYGATVARDVLPADSGEFQMVAALLGVAHPPGYPLYTLAGHLLICLIPAGTPAIRLSVLSAGLAAGTLLLVARAARFWARSLGASPVISLGSGLAAALALGASTTFWAQATTANIRMPTLFFGALALRALAGFALHRLGGAVGDGDEGMERPAAHQQQEQFSLAPEERQTAQDRCGQDRRGELKAEKGRDQSQAAGQIAGIGKGEHVSGEPARRDVPEEALKGVQVRRGEGRAARALDGQVGLGQERRGQENQRRPPPAARAKEA